MTCKAWVTARRVCALGLWLLAGCHGRHVELLEQETGPGCDGACTPLFDMTCADHLLPAFAGACTPIGVAACGTGLDGDGKGGCTPRLDAACTAPGQMAIPGGKCHAATACDTSVDRWGGLPSSIAVLYVDPLSTAPSPDGSRDKPFKTIGEAHAAIDRSFPAIIALFPGTYDGDVTLASADLWGACDGLSEIVGKSDKGAALHVDGGDAVRHIAFRGAGAGIELDRNAVLDGVWVHDTGAEGIRTVSTGAPFSVTDSLIENASMTGIHYRASDVSALSIQRSVVRGTRPIATVPDSGKGISIDSLLTTPGLPVTIDASVVEGNTSFGIDSTNTQVKITDSVVQHTKAASTLPASGYGLRANGGSVQVIGSLFADNVHAAIGATNVIELELQSIVVRDTKPDPVLGMGYGLFVVGGHVHLVDSLIGGSYAAGVMLQGAHADLASTLIMDTHAFGAEGSLGVGMYAAFDSSGHGSGLTMRNCVITGSAGAGLVASGAAVDLKDCAIRRTTLVTAANLGNGLVVNAAGKPVTPGNASLARTFIDRSAGAGIQIFGSSVSFDASVVLGCSGGAVLVAPELGLEPSFSAQDGSQCACAGALGTCSTMPSPLGP
jgi:hypothetical protein